METDSMASRKATTLAAAVERWQPEHARFY
jgi:hypothetical protein